MTTLDNEGMVHAATSKQATGCGVKDTQNRILKVFKSIFYC